jgi:hypothetical protein
MAGYLGLTLCLCLFFWRTHCQILQAPADPENGYLDLTEYPLPANFGGVFTYPTSVTQVYDEGVPMTIAWNTTYQHISLYIAYVRNISLAAPVDGAGNSQRQLQSESGSYRTTLAAFLRSSTSKCSQRILPPTRATRSPGSHHALPTATPHMSSTSSTATATRERSLKRASGATTSGYELPPALN